MLPTNLTLSTEDCSQGKYSLQAFHRKGCSYFPGDTSEPIASECELYFSRALKRGGCLLTEPRLASWKDQQ